MGAGCLGFRKEEGASGEKKKAAYGPNLGRIANKKVTNGQNYTPEEKKFRVKESRSVEGGGGSAPPERNYQSSPRYRLKGRPTRGILPLRIGAGKTEFTRFHGKGKKPCDHESGKQPSSRWKGDLQRQSCRTSIRIKSCG